MFDLVSKYRETLDDYMSFFVKYCLPEDGGLRNCVDDDGNIISEDRYIWHQGRGLWIFSRLYDLLEQKSDWLKAADNIFGYLCRNGRNKNNRWGFMVDSNGNITEDTVNIFSECFVMSGMGEYFRTTGNKKALDIALDSYEFTSSVLKNRNDHDFSVLPIRQPDGARLHSINMAFSLAYYDLGKLIGRRDICETGLALANEVLTDYYDPDKDIVFEYGFDDKRKDTPERRVCNIGHVVECMWFLLSIYEREGDTKAMDMCCHILLRHLEIGWDPLYDGLLLAIDAEGKKPVFWDKHDYKGWWVHTEALLSTLFAYKHTGDGQFANWHRKIYEYAYSKYPLPNGTWIHWLDRMGNTVSDSGGLPSKDPYHLPRAFMYMIRMIEQ